MSIWLRSSQVLLMASIVLISSAKAYAEESSQNIQLIKPVNNQIRNQVKSVNNKQDLNKQLLIASQNGDLRKVRSLAFQSADVNVSDQDGWTPLLWAAMNGYPEVAQFLLASRANPNTRNKYGWTPLMWAAGQGYDEIVRSLIASGARLNAQDSNGWTAMMWATDGNYQETAAILRNMAK